MEFSFKRLKTLEMLRLYNIFRILKNVVKDLVTINHSIPP